jgi:hypothetical protein
MVDHRQYAPATVRNRDFILDVLRYVQPTTDGLSSKAARCKGDGVSLVANDKDDVRRLQRRIAQVHGSCQRFRQRRQRQFVQCRKIGGVGADLCFFVSGLGYASRGLDWGVSTGLAAEGTVGG